MTLYKITGPDRQPCRGGRGQWPPPGEWRVESGPITLCEPGTLHLCRERDLPHWLVVGGEVWEAEAAGEVVEAANKVGCTRARLTRLVGILTPEVLRALTADAIRAQCAIVRRRLARDWRGDGRPEAALVAAEAVATALVTGKNLIAARDAANAAARAARAAAGTAEDAARGAAWTAEDAARDAARAAARAAAGGAAWTAAAARGAAWTAEDAARDAARGYVADWFGRRLLARLAGTAGDVDFATLAAEVAP